MPAVAEPRAHLEDVHLYLRQFEITGRSPRDRNEDVELIQDRFLDYLESTTAFGGIEYNLSGRRQLAPSALELRVWIALDGAIERTGVLDAVNVLFVGFWPLVPAWGNAEVYVTATLARPGQAPVAVYREVVRAPYSVIFYGWYRPGIAEAAYARAYEAAFGNIAARIAADAATYRAADAVVGIAPSPDPLPAPEVTTAALARPELARPEPTVLASRGFSVITSIATPRPDNKALLALSALGGVEVAGLLGVARVSSKARVASGETKEVASGISTQRGYRISLYSAPRTTGPFIYPTLGYVSQRIDNADVRSALERLNEPRASNGDIPAIVTDAQTGDVADAGTANVYRLDMQSGYGGVRLGYDLVGGTPAFEMFASITAGVNLLEYRLIRSVLATCGSDQPASACRTKHQGWDVLKSGALGATFGFRFPKIHSAVRFIFDYEIYRQFKYEHPLDVRGPPLYDPSIGRFQNEPLSMRGASLGSASFQLAFAGVY